MVAPGPKKIPLDVVELWRSYRFWGSLDKAAKEHNISRSTLTRRLAEWGIPVASRGRPREVTLISTAEGE